MELTASAQQADRKTVTRQTNKSKEDASSSHSKPKCQDHASWLIELSSTVQRFEEDSHYRFRARWAEHRYSHLTRNTTCRKWITKRATVPFFWQGKSIEDKREQGVGFAVQNSLLSVTEPLLNGSERIITIRLSTQT